MKFKRKTFLYKRVGFSHRETVCEMVFIYLLLLLYNNDF